MAGVGTSINNFESIHRDFSLHCEYTESQLFTLLQRIFCICLPAVKEKIFYATD
jgi:hypothetical protein